MIRLGKGSGFLFYFRVRSFSIFADPAISEPETGLTVRCYHESAVQADQRRPVGGKSYGNSMTAFCLQKTRQKKYFCRFLKRSNSGFKYFLKRR